MHSYATGDPVPIPMWVYYAVTIVIATIILAFKNRNLKEALEKMEINKLQELIKTD